MSKAFTKESDGEDDEHDQAAEEAAHAELKGVKNYITPSGLQRLKDEHRFLMTRERPAVTQVVTWAAGNGDRSENADISCNKRRLRDDRRPSWQTNRCREWWTRKPREATCGDAGLLRHRALRQRRRYGAVGEHRRPRRGRSASQPHQLDLALARALMKAGPGDRVALHAPVLQSNCRPGGALQRIPVEPFIEPPGAQAAPKTRPPTGGQTRSG